MHTKQQALNFFYTLPEDMDWDKIIQTVYKQYVVKSVEKGLKDIEEGRVVSHEDVKKRFSRK